MISQDRSADAIELEPVLNNLLPLLTAVQPQQLSLTLTAIAQGLKGRGTKLGQTLVQLNSYLRGLRPHLPALDRDIAELVQVTKTYTQATPDILRALTDFSVVSKTVYQQRANLAALFSTVTTASRDLRAFLDGNSPQHHLAVAGEHGHPPAAGPVRARVPLHAAGPGGVRAERQPGAGRRARTSPACTSTSTSSTPWAAIRPRDAPHYGDNLGPHCYSIPFRGISLNDGAGAATARGGTAGHKPRTTSTFVGPASESGLGLANSPQENELVNELAGLTLRQAPRSLPDWSSLLVGPLYRGAEVTLR